MGGSSLGGVAMSQTNGTLVVCDRCGKQTFVKSVGDEVLDGGYTRWNKFESLPEGWGRFKGYDLCPDCFDTWSIIENDFLSSIKEAK